MTRYRSLVVALVLLLPASAVAQAPDRVASLVPAATEILFAIGAGPRVVGVGTYADYPPQVADLPRLGGLVDPNLEAIIAVRPQLVVIDPAQQDLAARLAGLGIDTYEFATGSVAEMLAHVDALGARLDIANQAQAVHAQIESDLAAVAVAAAGRPRSRTLIVFGRRAGSFAELWVSGGVGYLHDVVELAGGSNAFAEIERQSFKSGLEAVLARVPDVVIEFVRDRRDADRVQREWRDLPGFGAVRVATIDGAWALRPSPRVGRLARLVLAALQPSGID